jgi:hypothetical protein
MRLKTLLLCVGIATMLLTGYKLQGLQDELA